MRDPYAVLAPLYDGMARDPAIRGLYPHWRETLIAAAREREVAGRVLVDIACGTGNSTIPWSRKRGWTVVGVDRSAAMLRVARRKSRAVRWVRQELSELRLDVRADFVTCHFDALNHVLDASDLQRIFRRVRETLRPGGLFLFDLNTLHMLRWLAGRDRLCRVGPHWFTSSNEYDEKSGVATFSQHWFVKKGRLFERRLVRVEERAFADAALERWLAAAGLRLLRVDTQVVIDEKPMRRLYLAERTMGGPARRV
jgi:ubiquinone/menaquinone biosynthesis C-methylase UbiE